MTTYATEKVGTTKDYSVFKYFDRNRVISKNHVEDLRKDMVLTEAGLEVSLPEAHALFNFESAYTAP